MKFNLIANPISENYSGFRSEESMSAKTREVSLNNKIVSRAKSFCFRVTSWSRFSKRMINDKEILVSTKTMEFSLAPLRIATIGYSHQSCSLPNGRCAVGNGTADVWRNNVHAKCVHSERVFARCMSRATINHIESFEPECRVFFLYGEHRRKEENRKAPRFPRSLKLPKSFSYRITLEILYLSHPDSSFRPKPARYLSAFKRGRAREIGRFCIYHDSH